MDNFTVIRLNFIRNCQGYMKVLFDCDHFLENFNF